MRAAFIMAGMLCGAAARAQDRAPPPPRPEERQKAEQKPPLSAEDAELVKQMALLERLDLLRNLELFEEEQQQKQ